MIDICQEGHSQRSAPQRSHMTHLRWHSCCTPRKPTGWYKGRDKMHRPTWGVCACQAPCRLLRPRKGTHAQLSLCLCGVPENLNLSGLDLGSAHNPGPALDSSPQSNLEPEQCIPGKHTHRELEQTQCGPDTASTPHTCQGYLFAVFLPSDSTTEQVCLNK